MGRCKITVLKRTIHQDLVGEYLKEEMGPVNTFRTVKSLW